MNNLHTRQSGITPTSTPAEGDRDILAAALEYAEVGLAVFPIHTPDENGCCSCGDDDCSSPGKHPRTKNGLKAATTNELDIRRWYRDAPDANIGLPCGALNGIFVLDVDGVEGESSLARLVEQCGPLPTTRKVLTGMRYQLYFKHPGGKIRTAAPIDRALPGLDSPGDGGYVVAPPSLHHTGKRYEIDSRVPEQIFEAPAWLVDFINRRPPPKVPGAAAANVDHDAFEEGSRNSSLASLAGSMRARGMTQDAIERAHCLRPTRGSAAHRCQMMKCVQSRAVLRTIHRVRRAMYFGR